MILPGLARPPNRSGTEILRWRQRPRGLLLAPHALVRVKNHFASVLPTLFVQLFESHRQRHAERPHRQQVAGRASAHTQLALEPVAPIDHEREELGAELLAKHQLALLLARELQLVRRDAGVLPGGALPGLPPGQMLRALVEPVEPI